MKFFDPYGTEIVPDVVVAYNYQGQVRLGVVQEVKCAKRYGRDKDYSGNPYVCIKVKQQGTEEISKVTSGNNLVVLFPLFPCTIK